MVKITNPEQMKHLVELMERNPSLATNFKRGVSQTEEKKTKWDSISSELNSLGPPVRNAKEWQKVWFDAKFKVKQKLLFNKKNLEATGGGPFKKKYLNELDQAIADLLGLNKVVDPVGNAFGGASAPNSMTSMCAPIQTQSTATDSHLTLNEVDFSSSILIAEDIYEENLNQEQDLPPKQPNTNIVSNFQQMLQKQTQVQEQLYEEVKQSLYRIESYLKESTLYDRKRFHLEEEKLKEYKIKMKREEEHQIQKLEVKKRQLDIEERKLKLSEKHSQI